MYGSPSPTSYSSVSSGTSIQTHQPERQQVSRATSLELANHTIPRSGESQAGRDGIEAEGFRQSDPPVGPAWDSPERGIVWFASSKEVARETCWRSGWWVWIEVPDDTLEYDVGDGEPYTGNYALSIDYVNTLRIGLEPGR